MEQQTNAKRTLRKVWYGFAITVSVLVLLLCTLGVIGTWLVERTLVDVTQNLLGATANTAGGLRRAASQIDQGLEEVGQISSAVSATSQKISQNIDDKGLILTLLPPEQEQKLVARFERVQETLSTIHEFLAAGISMYRSIDRLPFVSLPGLSQESIDELEQAVTETRSTVDEMRQSAQDVRSGASAQVDRVTQAADRVTQRLDDLRKSLSELDQGLARLQELALQLQSSVALIFGIVAVVLTLLLVYVIYTQVEFIRLEVGRWKTLKPPIAESPAPLVSEAVE